MGYSPPELFDIIETEIKEEMENGGIESVTQGEDAFLVEEFDIIEQLQQGTDETTEVEYQVKHLIQVTIKVTRDIERNKV